MQQVTKTLLKDGVGYSGYVIVTDADGNLLPFRNRIGTGNTYDTDAKYVENGVVMLEILSDAACIVQSSDGTAAIRIGDLDIVTVDDGWDAQSDFRAMVMEDLTILRGSIKANSGCGATLMHIASGYNSPLAMNIPIFLNDVAVAATSSTTGYIRLGSAPSENGIVQFPGSII